MNNETDRLAATQLRLSEAYARIAELEAKLEAETKRADDADLQLRKPALQLALDVKVAGASLGRLLAALQNIIDATENGEHNWVDRALETGQEAIREALEHREALLRRVAAVLRRYSMLKGDELDAMRADIEVEIKNGLQEEADNDR